MRHATGCGAAITLIVIATLLPFLPGSFDPVAASLSMTARAVGWVALLLVPFGALWLARPGRTTTRAALAAFCAVWALSAVAAVLSSGVILSAIVLLLGASLFARIRTAAASPRSPAAVYFAVVPMAVWLLQQALLGRAVEFSRDRAIRNAAPMIADIERYRAERGVYPPSLLAVLPDYKPGLIGIERYHYEPSGAAYNLAFEQIARDIATREFVVYNPRDEQVFTSHPMDLLQYSPELLQRTRGYFAVHEAAHPHWKYFWFD